MLFVFLGGAVGATLRTVLMWVPLPLSASAQLTGINLLGAFVLGVLLGAATGPQHDGPRVFWGTGVLGGFTSYSALIVGMRPEMDAVVGVLFGVLTVVAATGVALVSLRFGRRLRGRGGAMGEVT